MPWLSPYVSQGQRAWLALCAMLGLGSMLFTLAPPSDFSDWSWQAHVGIAQPWRWWTAAWVHLSYAHMGANIAALAVLALWGWNVQVQTRAFLSWFLAWPLMHMGLYAGAYYHPNFQSYAGLSGLIHAGAAIACLHGGAHSNPTLKKLCAAMLIVLSLKILGETPWKTGTYWSPEWGFHVASWGHFSGYLCGIVCWFATRPVLRYLGAVRGGESKPANAQQTN